MFLQMTKVGHEGWDLYKYSNSKDYRRNSKNWCLSFQILNKMMACSHSFWMTQLALKSLKIIETFDWFHQGVVGIYQWQEGWLVSQ